MLTARQIRGVEALFLAAPAYVAGLSALIDETAFAEGRSEGMDEVAMKPLSPAILMRLRDAAAEKSVMPLSETCKTSTAAAKKRR